MKKTIISMFAMALMTVFATTVAFAETTLNSPGSMPTITVANDTTNGCSGGVINGGYGCWSTSATARPGDVIAVQVYYKNTGNDYSESTTLSIKPKTTGTVSSVTFTGGVASLTAARSVGSATVQLSSAATVTYISGSANWNTNTGGGGSVNESGLFGTSGFNIGTLAPGEQGVLTVNFRVGQGTVTPPATKYQCNDGIDNDGDGLIDYPSDPGCSSPTDDDEYNAAQPTRYQCNDGIDNDGDGLIDYPSDPGCSSPTDNSEYNSSGPVTGYCEIDSFTVDGRSSITIEKGDSAQLRWNTTNCDYVRITSFSGNLDPDSTGTVRPTSDKTYTLTAYPNGPTATVRVYVEGNNNNRDACDIDSFRASRSSIERGQSVTLSWKVSGADRVEINGSSKSKNSSMSVSPYSTTTYRLIVEGQNCNDEASIRITVNEDNNARPQAITTVATIFGSTSAQLNGIAVPNTSNASTSAWFEWGPASSLGYRTSAKSIGSGNGSTPYSDIVNGLSAGTTYYYRAVVQNQNGTAYGDILPFRTQNVVAGTTVVRQPTRVVVQQTTVRDSVTAESTPSLLELRVESAYDHMCIGGEIEYVVTYRNISSVTLEDSVLRLALPKELTYTGANRGNYDAIDRIITIDVGRLQAGQQGSVTVRARVNDLAVRNNLTVMTATVVYTNPITRAQEDAIAYSLITVSDECPTVLGASVFGFGSFLPDTLLEWLLLILVILALILIGRNLYKKKEEHK